jgi:hypothetical protein
MGSYITAKNNNSNKKKYLSIPETEYNQESDGYGIDG